MSKELDRLIEEGRRIEGEIIRESEVERRQVALENERRMKEEKAQLEAEMRESPKRTAAALERKFEADRLVDVQARQRYTATMQAIADQLPVLMEMPVCKDCGRPLTFRDMPPLSDSDEVNLICPGCRTIVRSRFPDNPFRVCELSSAILYR